MPGTPSSLVVVECSSKSSFTEFEEEFIKAPSSVLRMVIHVLQRGLEDELRCVCHHLWCPSGICT